MVAFHFPPLAGSSGIQRTLRFVQHLPRFGWQPIVLSAHPAAYERTSADLLDEVPEHAIVGRALALDSGRHLAVRGRRLNFLSMPDRWASWRFDAVRVGMRLVRQHRPDVIWSTYPIATAHLIGAELHRRTGIPWVADFRDPMAQVGYPPDPAVWKSFKRIEEVAAENADAMVFTTPGAVREYAGRYPAANGRMFLVENGYDEESFAACDAEGRGIEPLVPGRITLVHSGTVYREDRDPQPLLQALARLIRQGAVDARTLTVRFRATANDEFMCRLVQEQGIEDVVEIAPPIGYRAALREMLCADGLLLLQGPSCNDQIPAKVYEYLRARRPILALTDAAGDTARVLARAGVTGIARIDDPDTIASALAAFLASIRDGRAALPGEAAIHDASREIRTKALADVMAGLRH